MVLRASSRALPDMGDRVVIRNDPDKVVHEVGLCGDRSAVLTCRLSELQGSRAGSHEPYHMLEIVDERLTCVVCIGHSIMGS